jgi:K+ transporter
MDWRQRVISNSRVQQALRIMVVVAVGMIMGDGVLTPAISGLPTKKITCVV